MRVLICSTLLTPLASPNSSHVSETRRRAESLKNPPPTTRLCGWWVLKKNGSPGARTRNSRPPLGCQKFTSATSGRAARKWYQSLSVTPTYARTAVIVHPRHAGSSGSGYIGGIRPCRELPPTRFPIMLTGVHRGSPPFVTWADGDGSVSADTGEPRRMRPHLRP